jgi:hypothetical protein
VANGLVHLPEPQAQRGAGRRASIGHESSGRVGGMPPSGDRSETHKSCHAVTGDAAGDSNDAVTEAVRPEGYDLTRRGPRSGTVGVRRAALAGRRARVTLEEGGPA